MSDFRLSHLEPLCAQPDDKTGCVVRLRFHNVTRDVFLPFPNVSVLKSPKNWSETQEVLTDVEKLTTYHGTDSAWWKSLSRAETEEEEQDRVRWEDAITGNIRSAIAGAFSATVGKHVTGLVNQTFGPVYPLYWVACNPYNYVRTLFMVMVEPCMLQECIQSVKSLGDKPLKKKLSARLFQCAQDAEYEKVKYEEARKASSGQMPRLSYSRVFKNVSLTPSEMASFDTSAPMPFIRVSELFGKNKNAADQLLKCLRVAGFACLRLDAEEHASITKNILQKAIQFFNLPAAIKNQSATTSSRTAGYNLETNREVYHGYIQFPGQHPPWPTEEVAPGFEHAVSAALVLFQNICKEILNLIQETYGGGGTTALTDAMENFDDPQTIKTWGYGSAIRVMRYHKPQSKTRVMCVSHSDTSLLTLATASLPELQILRRCDQKWVFPEEQCTGCSDLVVFPGSFLARMTEGYFDATIHRVVRRFNEQRLVIPYFCRPTPDGTVVNIIRPEGYSSEDLDESVRDNQYMKEFAEEYPFEAEECMRNFLGRSIKILPVFSVHTLESQCETV
eukprot:ANDGO_01037.mRNA.1 oxidoreductase